MKHAPGRIRDSIIGFLSENKGEATVNEITQAIEADLGPTSPSSVRSYLSLNVPDTFTRTARGHYLLREDTPPYHIEGKPSEPKFSDQATLVCADCFDWLAEQKPNSIHAVVTDPPYGLVEYSEKEQVKLRNGKGGVWRIPPSFDGHKRSPLPRFTTLTKEDHATLHKFFLRFGAESLRILVPGANVVIASNPLLSHLVTDAMDKAGFEVRGAITRLVMTMRGGDRPKNAHKEFKDVSVMPRSMYEPWVVLRKPLDGRVQDNLRKWGTGGFRRTPDDRPFGDVIRSSPTSPRERELAPHPSLKPQAFMRSLVRGVLPLGKGIVCDPFAGAGSTLAAANAVGYRSIGVEADESFFRIAHQGIPKLSALSV